MVSNARPSFAGTIELLADYNIDGNLIPREDGFTEAGYFQLESFGYNKFVKDTNGDPVKNFHKYPKGLTWEMVEASLKQDAWEFVRENYA